MPAKDEDRLAGTAGFTGHGNGIAGDNNIVSQSPIAHNRIFILAAPEISMGGIPFNSSIISASARLPVRLESVISTEPPIRSFRARICLPNSRALSKAKALPLMEPPTITAVKGRGREAKAFCHFFSAAAKAAALTRCGEPWYRNNCRRHFYGGRVRA